MVTRQSNTRVVALGAQIGRARACTRSSGHTFKWHTNISSKLPYMQCSWLRSKDSKVRMLVMLFTIVKFWSSRPKNEPDSLPLSRNQVLWLIQPQKRSTGPGASVRPQGRSRPKPRPEVRVSPNFFRSFPTSWTLGTEGSRRWARQESKFDSSWSKDFQVTFPQLTFISVLIRCPNFQTLEKTHVSFNCEE